MASKKRVLCGVIVTLTFEKTCEYCIIAESWAKLFEYSGNTWVLAAFNC